METLIGVIIVVVSLILLVSLTFYNRYVIEKLADQDFPNLREAHRGEQGVEDEQTQ